MIVTAVLLRSGLWNVLIASLVGLSGYGLGSGQSSQRDGSYLTTKPQQPVGQPLDRYGNRELEIGRIMSCEWRGPDPEDIYSNAEEK